MSVERFNLALWEPVQAHRSLMQAWAFAKPLLMAGYRLVIEVRQEKRSDAENRLLHALLGYISKTQEWAGKKRDIETWKRLLVASWLRARGEPIEMLPALDGCGVDIVFRRTSELTRSECAELIEFIYAWAAGQGIEFPPPPAVAPERPRIAGKRKTVEAEQKQKVAIAEAEANALKAKADGEAYANLKIAQAQAEALRVQNSALSQNKDVLELRRIEVEATKAARWDGKLPQAIYAGAPIPFLKVEK